MLDDIRAQASEVNEDAEASLRHAILSRKARLGKPHVVTLPQAPPATVRHLLPGTIVFFAAPAGSRSFERILEAAQAADSEALDLLAGRVGSDLVRTFISAGPEARRPRARLEDVPSLGEFRYKHKQLVRGLFPIPSWEVAATSVLWTGGPLADDQFAFVEYLGATKGPALDTLVLKIPPELSEIEMAVIRQVPEDLSELHVRGTAVAVTDVLVRLVGEVAGAIRDIVGLVFAPRRMTIRRFGRPQGLIEGDAVGICGPMPYTLIGGSMSSSVRARLEQHVESAMVDSARLGASVDALLDLRQELLAGRMPEES